MGRESGPSAIIECWHYVRNCSGKEGLSPSDFSLSTQIFKREIQTPLSAPSSGGAGLIMTVPGAEVQQVGGKGQGSVVQISGLDTSPFPSSR